MYDHWLVRGAQSAIFYYVSCGPCYAASYKRKRRKEAMRDRKTYQSRVDERPDAYRHPAPFEINPYWQEEMALGPSPPPRRNRKKTKDSVRKRAINTAGTYSSLNSSGSESQRGPKEPGEAHISNFGRKRYHRPDEEFAWIGEEEERNEELGLRKPKWDYQFSKAPPVNDLHPPIVSMVPTKAEDRRWMKQPPPSTAFMKGKKGVTTIERVESAESRAVSTTTNRPLSQQSTRGRESPRASEKAALSQVDSSTNRQALDGVETIVSASARQHSSISTMNRHSVRPYPVTSGATSTETSDADDEDESPQPQLPTKPRPSYRLDVSIASPRPLRSRQLNSRQPSTVPSHNGLSHPSSSLRPHSTSENISPRNSPRSVASRPYSRVSLSSEEDEDETNARLQSPSFGTTKRVSATGKPAATRARSTSNNPRAASKQRKADKGHSRVSLEPEASGVDSAIMIDDTDLDLSYAGLDEDKARERMWLGAQGEEVSRLVKRWSSEF